MAKKVLFVRVSPAAHAWVMKKVEQSKEKDISACVVVERLLMNDKHQIERNRDRRASRRGQQTATA